MKNRWESKNLGVLCDEYGGIIQTGPFGSQLHQHDYVETGTPVIMPKDIINGKINLLTVARIDDDSVNRLSRHKVKSGDIVIPRRGEISKCTLITKKEKDFICGTGCLKITPPQQVLNSSYFKYYLGTSNIIEWLENNAVGATMMNLSGAILKRLPVVLPTLLEQQKIASVLYAYDDLIENNLARIKFLEEMAQITYEEWFVRMQFPGHKTAEINPETDLPEGWFNGCITDICHVNKDSITSKNAPDYIRYLDIASVETGNYFEPEKMCFTDAPSRARRKLRYGDTIFSTVRPNRKTYSLILDKENDLVASTGFAALRPLDNESFSFVYMSVANQNFVDAAVAVAGGAAYPAVKQSDFEKINVTVPNNELIKKFCEIYNQSFELIALLVAQNKLLTEARDILLPRLMTGMIDIEKVELPEALLARIQASDTPKE